MAGYEMQTAYGPKLDIIYESADGVVHAGQVLHGSLRLNFNHHIRIKSLTLNIKGLAYTHWGDDDADDDETSDSCTGQEVYFDRTLELLEEQYGPYSPYYGHSDAWMMELPDGNRIFPFRHEIPPTCPSSYEDGHCFYVQYICKANIAYDRVISDEYSSKISYESRVKSTEKYFTVIHDLDLRNEPGVLHSAREDSSRADMGCVCCIEGSADVTFLIHKAAYVPGEIIKADIRVNNNSTTDLNCKFSIKQYINYTGYDYKMKASTKQKSKEIATRELSPVFQGDSMNITDFCLKVPPVPPSRLDGCQIIDLKYIVRFYATSWNSIKISHDIVIGTVPLNGTIPLRNSASVVTQQPTIQPSAPSIDNISPQFGPAADFDEAPPPSYEECMRTDNDPADGKEAIGSGQESRWQPRYPTYSFDQGI